MNEKLKEIKSELAKLTDAIAEIEKHCKEEHGFVVGQMYWYVSWAGKAAMHAVWADDESDKGALAINNAFHTQQEAEQRLEYLKAEATLRRFMKSKPNGRWSPFYFVPEAMFLPSTSDDRYQPKFLYSDQQTIHELITTHERELKIYFEVAND